FTLATLLSALLAILSTLWRRSLRLNLLATFTAASSPATDILRSGLVVVVAVPFLFSAFGVVLVFQIRIRISWSDCSARNRSLFAMFNAPFVFLALALFKGFGRTWSNRCARAVLEFLAFVLTLPLLEAFIWRRTWNH